MSTDFIVSPSAQTRIATLLATEPAGSYLRVAVEGGGCSGFQYKFDFDSQPAAQDDARFGTAESLVVVDGVSLGFLAGSMLDYVETLGASSFEIKNPNAKSSCGCGNSFSVAL
jgi:iron-sulfur cluster assembly accessory protein